MEAKGISEMFFCFKIEMAEGPRRIQGSHCPLFLFEAGKWVEIVHGARKGL
jgi:hypothetical protein